MIDFKKLTDPNWIAQCRAEEAERQAKQEEKDKALWAAVDACQDAYESMPATERSFVRKARHMLSTHCPLSEKQEKWLFDLGRKYSPAAKARRPSP